MEFKNSLSSFTDRELLELILGNQVQFEQRLNRIETYLSKKSDQETKEMQPYQTDDYWTAPYYKEEQQQEHSFANTFQALIEKTNSAKSLIDNLPENNNLDTSQP